MRKRASLVTLYVVLLAYSAIILLPLVSLFSASFKPDQEVFDANLIPREPTLAAYRFALEKFPLGRFLLNSLLVSSIVSLGQMLTSALAGYALARVRFPGREPLFAAVIVLLLVPGEVTFLPLYELVARLGWLDRYQALSVPFLATPMGIFLMRQFFKTLPQDLFDAARIDGAGHLRILWHVALPLARPILGALGALSFLSAWNMYLWPLVVTRSTQMQTIQIGVNMILNEEAARWNVVAAGAVLALLPTLIAFLVAQRQFVRGITLGGLKG
ncbi:glycerol-3-phosphate ABC transporter permease [Thermus scotoductus]|uniref:Glycerol-3-phosphate ABC transporter permease n=1 Tax=Thermus scotoductus TaxID=37636 RepID=A0A430SHL1_THESC|nr:MULTISPECIES: carbohydrate ABC transporter permease [Thermus]QWK21014.1 MAG: carbohydrate ABC transporter permease [Thermus antranikianii]RTH39726.1 glycerol-3-phosphate ABC transporter permease [Thermus scotoductus]